MPSCRSTRRRWVLHIVSFCRWGRSSLCLRAIWREADFRSSAGHFVVGVVSMGVVRWVWSSRGLPHHRRVRVQSVVMWEKIRRARNGARWKSYPVLRRTAWASHLLGPPCFSSLRIRWSNHRPTSLCRGEGRGVAGCPRLRTSWGGDGGSGGGGMREGWIQHQLHRIQTPLTRTTIEQLHNHGTTAFPKRSETKNLRMKHNNFWAQTKSFWGLEHIFG